MPKSPRNTPKAVTILPAPPGPTLIEIKGNFYAPSQIKSFETLSKPSIGRDGIARIHIVSLRDVDPPYNKVWLSAVEAKPILDWIGRGMPGRE